jgi:Fe-S-cluster containining protein
MRIPSAKSKGFECRAGCSECCTLPPLKKDFLLKYQHLVKTPGIKVILEFGYCFALTPDYMCPFLVGGRCSVYDDRPKICRQYGQVKNMPCVYFTPSGRERTPAEMAATKAHYAEKYMRLKLLGKDIERGKK